MYFSFNYLFYPTFRYLKEELSPPQQSNPPYGECYSCQINNDGTQLAGCYSNGFINIFNLSDLNKRAITFKASESPITCIKWNKLLKTTIISVDSEGNINHWHSSSGKILHHMKEDNNCINSVDYSNDYRKFATGGSDVTVRLYDEGMKTKIVEMKPFKFEQPGHSSRIFCVKFNPDNNNMIISGGWDKTIQIYDVREGQIVNSIFGPQICGDALDINGSYFLAGAWGQSKQICIYDIRNLNNPYTVLWENQCDYIPTYIYSAKFDCFSDTNKLFAIGGINKNLYRLFDFNSFNSLTLNTKEEGYTTNVPYPIYGSTDLSSSCYSIDFYKIAQNKEYMAIGCGDGGIRFYIVTKK